MSDLVKILLLLLVVLVVVYMTGADNGYIKKVFVKENYSSSDDQEMFESYHGSTDPQVDS